MKIVSWNVNGIRAQAVPSRLFLRHRHKRFTRFPEWDVLLHGRVPLEVKYEVENYLKLPVKKKGLRNGTSTGPVRQDYVSSPNV